MRAHQAEHAIATMCRVLRLSRRGYYVWLAREPSEQAQRDKELLGLIRGEHLESHGIYRAPRIHAALRRRGVRVGRKRVARLMREAGLRGVTRRGFKTPTTRRDPRRRPAPDLVECRFEGSGPNQPWVADITELVTGRGRRLAFTRRCDAFGITVSTGWVGGCFDNAMAERFFATFEVELRRLFGGPPTHAEGRRRVFAFI